MKTSSSNNKVMSRWLLGLVGCGFMATLPLQGAMVIHIVNPGLEDPVMDNEGNTSFDGAWGNPAGSSGWWSNEPSASGAEHVDQWYPGRTGDNVLYLRGTTTQNFYTKDFDMGVNLASFSTYTLTFDVLRWYGWDGVTSITEDDYVTLRVGVYTGADYDSRIALDEYAGNLYLLDGSTPVDKVTMNFTFTTGAVASGTKFWIGGDANGNAEDGHRAIYDNFHMEVEVIPEPSTVALLLFGALGGLMWFRKSHLRSLCSQV